MSGLTEEQRKKIEENKRRALARRAEKLSPKKDFSGSVPLKTAINKSSQNHAGIPPKNENKFTVYKAHTSHGNTHVPNISARNTIVNSDLKPDTGKWNSSVSVKRSGTSTHNNSVGQQSGQTPAQVPNPNLLIGSNSSSQSAGVPSAYPKTNFGSNVTAKCLLISREMFEVNVGFCQPLIELFKTMKTKQYDAVSKRWSFKLEEYNRLVAAMRAMGPQVKVVPLPQAILSAFSQQLKGIYPNKETPTADLSEVDKSLVNSLLPFQREGVNFGIYKQGRILIADDMGLGKTIQAICLSCYYRREWPLLIVVPSSVRFDWAQQFQRWVPSLNPQQIFVATTGKDRLSDYDVCILSYDLMTKKAKELLQKHFNVVIMDECHLLKNFKTARCKAAMPVLKSATRVILLSGTPALSRPQELYTQISAVKPYMFQYQDFGVRYCDGKKNNWGWDFSGSSNMGELQILLEEKIMIRRLKKDVLSQLPAKIRQMVLLDPASVKTNKQMEQQSKTMHLKSLKGMERRGALLEYFHSTGAAKVKAVKDYVIDLMDMDRKFIIFAHHQEVLDAIESAVKSKTDTGYIRVDGKTSPEQRNYFCKKFQTNDSVTVAILSITAANAGLNLSAASLVVFGELFWNPGILVQAEDRAHRMGQQDMVTVHYLVARGTADDHLWPLVQKKLEVLNKAGLSKDDFSTADTNVTQLKDSSQTDLMQFFEESFIEDEIDENVARGNDVFDHDRQEIFKSKISPSDKGKDKIVPTSKEKTLFNYFGTNQQSSTFPENSSTSCEKYKNSDQNHCNCGSKSELNNNDEGVIPDDDLDLFMADDDEWTSEVCEPQNKKPKF